MMMRMLSFGGMPVFATGHRPKDTMNPHGYFEHPKVKTIAHDNAFLHDLAGSAIKIVVPLIEFLPDAFPARVIYLDRSARRVAESQARMAAALTGQPQTLAESLETVNYLRQRADNFFSQARAPERLTVVYDAVLKNPSAVARDVAAFLKRPLNIERMTAAVERPRDA